ncbi:MAG: hypothetical protein GF368_04140 [Candidatus Aenigmarchaeota archaeon]|nr:hypothetical protein [Candidatus Aenigmarchaeota archaeon]
MEGYQNIIDKTFEDPITDLLLKNSNLTRIQFETIVIDMLIDLISDNNITFEKKTLFRGEKVSRGSFSRSLQQARKNIIKSIFTIVLLSYIGVFDERPFDDYVFLAEKLSDYVELVQTADKTEANRVLKRVENELLTGISALVKPTNIRIT